MVSFKNYKITVDAYAPKLKPKSNTADMKQIQALYSDLENRFDGIEDQLLNLGMERLVIDIVKRGGIVDDEDS